MPKRSRKPINSIISYDEVVKLLGRNRFLRARNFIHQDIRHVIDMFFLEVKKQLVDNKEVNIPGFGRFYRRFKDRRRILDPKTGEERFVPSRFVVVFLMGSDLKRILGSKVNAFAVHESKVLAKIRNESGINVIAEKKAKTPKKSIPTDL